GTVLASQVDALLPALAASAAKTVMFMFNYFGPLSRLRSAVGASRFAFGFPAVLARLEHGRLTAQFYGRGIRTTVTDPAWAKLFTAAGARSVVRGDMESWLRGHVAFTVPLMLAAAAAAAPGAGVSWRQARARARAPHAGLRLGR